VTDGPLLELTNVTSGYTHVPILREVSFSINPGECVVLVGPNGHGKSTILLTISGLLRIQSGTISFDGLDVSKTRSDVLVSRGLVHIPQGDHVFGDMSVLENLSLGAFPKTAQKRKTERLEHVLTVFPRLAERLKQRARTLSGGERRMLALGRGLMADAKIMMIDEPSLGLAPVIIDEVYELITQVVREGMTILLVEENFSRVTGIADTVHLVENGEILVSGTPDHVLSDPVIRKTYLGVVE
jgi:branched-chain amino acid transport system ATP-binding protein